MNYNIHSVIHTEKTVGDAEKVKCAQAFVNL